MEIYEKTEPVEKAVQFENLRLVSFTAQVLNVDGEVKASNVMSYAFQNQGTTVVQLFANGKFFFQLGVGSPLFEPRLLAEERDLTIYSAHFVVVGNPPAPGSRLVCVIKTCVSGGAFPNAQTARQQFRGL